MNSRIILYGAGKFGLLALKRYGREQVAYFCDNFSTESEIEGVPVIRPDKMLELCKSEVRYRVVITPGNFDIRREMAEPLAENGIRYTCFERGAHLTGGTRAIHIQSNSGELYCDYNVEDVKGFERRIPLTFGLLQKAYDVYRTNFEGKRIDLTVFIGDHCLDAFYNKENSKIGFVLAYNSVPALEDVVVMIPDYRVCYDEENYAYQETPSLCRKAAETHWEDGRILWKGNITSDDSRSWLKILAEKNPDILAVDDPVNHPECGFVPMTDFAKHKYLLDIRGYGWSDRLKILLQLGRPIFMISRPFKEWYTDKLVPWEHFIPVKEDMSDLIENYYYMEEHPEKYVEIVSNMRDFADKYLSPEAVLKYTRDVILKYGVVESIEL